MRQILLSSILRGGLVISLLGATPAFTADTDGFIGGFHVIREVASTVPGNGDVNPYGVAVVPTTTGKLVKDHVLVSNFNDKANAQGTGTTIVQIGPGGDVNVFAQIDANHLPGPCPGGVGLTTALVALRSGWVIVGSLPTSDGSSATAQPGCLIVLNDSGQAVETISGTNINGPWDMTAQDYGFFAVLFVTNVLNGTQAANGAVVDGGTVVRLALFTPQGPARPVEVARMVIASGFGEHTDPAALVVGPTGVGLGRDGALYVADTVGNRITAISDALFRLTLPSPSVGRTVSQDGHLNNPLGLAIAPNGDILTVNASDGNIVETSPGGAQVAFDALDTTPTPPGLPGSGALFGLAVAANGQGVYFVDDDVNTLNLLH